MLSAASWETMRIVAAKQTHTQGSLKFIDWGKQFLIDAHKTPGLCLIFPAMGSGWKGGFGLLLAFIFCLALSRSVGTEERGAEWCGEHIHPLLELLLSKAPLSVQFDEISSFALEMGWFGFLQRGKDSLK